MIHLEKIWKSVILCLKVWEQFCESDLFGMVFCDPFRGSKRFKEGFVWLKYLETLVSCMQGTHHW